jgi:hypothetical protein
MRTELVEMQKRRRWLFMIITYKSSRPDKRHAAKLNQVQTPTLTNQGWGTRELAGLKAGTNIGKAETSI